MNSEVVRKRAILFEGLYVDHDHCLQMIIGPRSGIRDLTPVWDIFGNRLLNGDKVAWCGKAHIMEDLTAYVNIDGDSTDGGVSVVLEENDLVWANGNKWLKVSYTLPQLWFLQGRPRRTPLISVAFLQLSLLILEQFSCFFHTLLHVEFFCNGVFVPDIP